MLRFAPVKKLSTHMTFPPSASNRSQRCEPRKPAPPVTNTRVSRCIRRNSLILRNYNRFRRPVTALGAKKAISYLENQDAIKNVLLEHRIAISMDGRGSWRDNVFLERFWRSVKYLVDAVIGYNSHRPHSSLDGRTPDQANFN